MSAPPYRLSISMNLPRITTEGESFTLTYDVRNISSTNFPGGPGGPDLIDGKMIIEAKGGVPSLQKVKTAFGQLVFYREHEPSFNVAFLFPKVWLEAENLQIAFEILRKYQVALLPV